MSLQGFVDKRRTQANNTSQGTTGGVNYTSTAAGKTRLAAANAGYFTTARLNNMTKNDVGYALRQLDDAGSF